MRNDSWTKFFCKETLSVSLLFLSSLSFASDLPSIKTNLLTGIKAINENQLQKDVSFLASDQLKGRLALTKGDQLAIDWLAKSFAKIGLKPAAGKRYLQAVPLIEYVPDSKNSYLSLQQNGKTTQWKKPDVFSEFHKDIHLSGNLVFAGYGITAPDLHYDDYQTLNVKNKIVLIFEHEPQERNAHSIFNGTGNTCFATTRVKALNAQKHGAIAVLIAPEPNRQHPSNQERYSRIGGSVNRNTPLPSFVLANDELHIPVAIISDTVANQIVGDAKTLSQWQSQIDDDLKSRSQALPNSKITLHDQIKSSKSALSYNVVGLLEGSDPKLKNETIIISAHHDHDGMDGKNIFHGADDNASGTVGVLSVARALVQNNHAESGLKSKRSILFVVFAAEERGLLGAFYMAAHPLRPLATTRAMINFDMIGRNESPTPQTDGLITIPSDTSNRLNLIGTHYSPDYQKVIEEENKFIGLTLDNRFNEESALNVFFRSDQFPFVLKNIPAFWWFTGFHPDYHHVTDTADKMNYSKMQKILQLAYLSAYSFANDVTPPQFIKNPGLS